MKSSWQTVLLIAVVMGLVGAAAYLTEFTQKDQKQKIDDVVDDNAPTPRPPLFFPYWVSKWVKDDAEFIAEKIEAFRGRLSH